MNRTQQQKAIKEAVLTGLDWWVEDSEVKTAPIVDGTSHGPHHYGEIGRKSFIGPCAYGCGCQMGQSWSTGPTNPFGPCPKNPRSYKDMPESELDHAIMRDVQLHEQVKIIYVVDGWQVHYSSDDGNTYKKFDGDTPMDALKKCFCVIRNKRNRL